MDILPFKYGKLSINDDECCIYICNKSANRFDIVCNTYPNVCSELIESVLLKKKEKVEKKDREK